jgi:dTDP-4-dehydrorhamnose 3,5-epimerase
VKFIETSIEGAWLLESEPRRDERGYFARTWCQREFAARGLVTHIAECATSLSHRAGTLRGLHYQTEPFAQAKLVRCARGAIWDVIVDLRPGSASRLAWFAAELTATSQRMLYVPPGCAHGFVTLADATEVCYQLSEAHQPGSEAGLRWNDPAIGIRWPRSVHAISPRDASWPLVDELAAGKSNPSARQEVCA